MEEPPDYLKFVLATTDPEKMLPTVLSRCLQFNLRPMAPETVMEHLGNVLAAEGVPAEPQALRLISRAARGSMRDALSLTDQAIAFGSGKLEETSVRLMLGSVDRSYVFQLIDALALGDGKTVVETAEVLRVHGLSAASTLEDMSVVLQRMAVLQAVPQMAAAVDAGDPDAAATARLAALLPADETQLLYSICLHGRAELGLAPDEYAALTMVLLRLLAFKPSCDGAEKKTLKRSETGADNAPVPVVAVPAPVPEPAAAPDSTPPWISEAPPQRIPKTEVKEALETAPVASEAIDIEANEALARAGTAPAAEILSSQYAHPVEQVEQRSPVAQGAVQSQPMAPATSAALTQPEPVVPTAQVTAPNVHTVAEPAPCATPSAVVGKAGNPARHYTPTPEGDVWHTVVRQLAASEAITALVRELALQSQLMARDGGHWLLRVERESINQPAARERLRSALEAAGHAQQISIEVGTVTDSPARRNAVAEQERQRVAQDVVMSDPFVQSMLQAHDAKIVPGSIKPL